MKKNTQFFQLLAWIDQVAADPEIGDFALRVGLALVGNARLSLWGEHARVIADRHAGALPVAGEASVGYAALMAECRASKDGVRKAVKALAARGHIDIAPGTAVRSATYALVLLPRDRPRAEAIEGIEPVHERRLHDAYRAVTIAAAMPATKPPSMRARSVLTGTPQPCATQHTPKALTPAPGPSRAERRRQRQEAGERWDANMSPTRRAAMHEAELRARRNQPDSGEDTDGE